MKGHARLWTLALLAGASFFAACASARPVPESGAIVVRTGDEFEWRDQRYRLVAVQEDFVFLRYVRPEGVRGEISGWVKEVFRVDRYDLGEGRWAPRPELDGLSVMWKGGDAFALSATGEGEPGGEGVSR